MKGVHIRQTVHCATSQGSFNHDQTKHVPNGGCQDAEIEEASDQKNQNWGFYDVKCIVEIWDYEEIQLQLSAMGRNQNVWENIAAKLYDNGYKRMSC